MMQQEKLKQYILQEKNLKFLIQYNKHIYIVKFALS